MDKQEAINHVVSSARYWSGDTYDNWSYPNNLGLEKAFEAAVWHVKNSHGFELDATSIDKAKKILGLKSSKYLI